MDTKNTQQQKLQRTLKPRHIQLIALGGSIGTGLFLALGYAVNSAGPGGALLAYGIIGFMVYFLITGLGEMATRLPVAGSFETYATRFVDPALGFALGWNFWFSWSITLGVEAVAGAILMRFWFPDVPAVIWSFLFIVILLGINLLSARAFGEAEFWFAGIKVVTIVIFLIVGTLMIFGVVGGTSYGLSNYSNPFPNGLNPVLVISFAAAFAFQGVELIGVTAGESENPQKTMPKACNTLIWRVLLFYIGAIFVVGAIIPWQEAGVDVSPFTMVFEKAGFGIAATIVNLVIITSVLSCGNTGIYCASRVLWSLAEGGRAPKIFTKLNKRGVPTYAILVSFAVAALCLLTGFFAVETVYVWLLSASGLAGLVTWFGISVSHYRFRRMYVHQKGSPEGLNYTAPAYPFGPIFATVLILAVVIGQAFDPIGRMSLYLGGPLFFILFFWYKFKHKTKLVPLDEGDISETMD